MNEKDIKTLMERDNILREAINRWEQNLPPMPDDLNARLLQRMEQKDEQRKRRLWLYVVSGVAASILLLLTFHFWQETEETPPSVVAKQAPPKQTITVKKPEVVEQKMVAVVEESKIVQEVMPRRKMAVMMEREREEVEEEGVMAESDMEPPTSETAELEHDPLAEDPYAFNRHHIQEIRSRGERLQQEVVLVLNGSQFME